MPATGRALAVMLASGLSCILLLACEEGLSGGGSKILPAAEIRDGVPAFIGTQTECPVCGRRPLNPEFYSEVQVKMNEKEGEEAEYETQRVYFDQQKCVKAFEQDRQKYKEQMIEKAHERTRRAFGAQSGGGG